MKKFEFLECVSFAKLEEIAEDNELVITESDDYEVGLSTIKLIAKSSYIDELRAHFVLSGSSVGGSSWRCIFVESEISQSGSTQS